MTGPGAARVAAALLVVTAGLFAIGAARERGDVHAEATATYGAESGESSEQHAAETAADAGTTGEERAILGVDPEAPGLVALVVVASIGLAAGLWFTGKRGLALCTAAFRGLVCRP